MRLAILLVLVISAGCARSCRDRQSATPAGPTDGAGAIPTAGPPSVPPVTTSPPAPLGPPGTTRDGDIQRVRGTELEAGPDIDGAAGAPRTRPEDELAPPDEVEIPLDVPPEERGDAGVGDASVPPVQTPVDAGPGRLPDEDAEIMLDGSAPTPSTPPGEARDGG